MGTNQIYFETKYFVKRLGKLFLCNNGFMVLKTYSTILFIWYHNGLDPDRFLPMGYPRSY